jgi:acetylornithine/succinyldiaminopimelate/putrescine aminotransferase
LPDGFTHVDYDDIDAVKAATTDRTAAVMLEPVQGEGGVNVPSAGYLGQVRQWCDENGLLLILDEVQTGLGRLGKLFGYEVFDVEPDVMTLGKGLGGGVPIGAFLAKDSASVFEPKSEHGSTFGGNPLTCAAAFASTKHIIDNDLPAHAQEVGEYLGERLRAIGDASEIVAEVRGMGLLWAMEYTSEMAAPVMAACNKGGLLLGLLAPNGNRLMPPLTVTEAEIALALDRLEAGLAEAARGTAT